MTRMRALPKRPGFIALATLGLLVLLIVVALGPGRSLIPARGAAEGERTFITDRTAEAMAVAEEWFIRATDDELVQAAGFFSPSLDEPTDWGPYRIVFRGDPEWVKVFASPAKSRLTEEQIAQIEAKRRSRSSLLSLTETRARIPGGLREPRWLPPGFTQLFIEGAVWPDGDYYVRYAYFRAAYPGSRDPDLANKGITIIVGQGRPLEYPTYVSGRNDRFDHTQLGTIQGQPAVFEIPKPNAPKTNPKSIKWVKNGILFGVADETGGVADLATLLRIAESVP